MLSLALLTGYTFGQLAIAVVIIVAVCGVVYVAMRASGFTPPPWVIQVFWIVAVAAVCILAIKFLLSLG